MKKLLLLSGLCTSLVAANSQAADLSFEVGIKGMKTDSEFTSPVKQKTKSDWGKSVYAYFEHPVPYVPNVRAEYFDNSNALKSGAGDAQTSFTDLALYYSFNNAGITLDVGLSARKTDFEAGTSKADTTFGNGYVKLQLDLPVTGLGWGIIAQHDLGLNGGQHAQDYDFYVRYKSTIGLGLGVGYRLQKYEIEYKNAASNSKQKIDGAYVSVFYHF